MRLTLRTEHTVDFFLGLRLLNEMARTRVASTDLVASMTLRIAARHIKKAMLAGASQLNELAYAQVLAGALGLSPMSRWNEVRSVAMKKNADGSASISPAWLRPSAHDIFSPAQGRMYKDYARTVPTDLLDDVLLMVISGRASSKAVSGKIEPAFFEFGVQNRAEILSGSVTPQSQPGATSFFVTACARLVKTMMQSAGYRTKGVEVETDFGAGQGQNVEEREADLSVAAVEIMKDPELMEKFFMELAHVRTPAAANLISAAKGVWTGNRLLATYKKTTDPTVGQDTMLAFGSLLQKHIEPTSQKIFDLVRENTADPALLVARKTLGPMDWNRIKNLGFNSLTVQWRNSAPIKAKIIAALTVSGVPD